MEPITFKMEPLKDYEGIYTINRQGVIKNKHGHIMSHFPHSKGYVCVSLTKNKKQKTFKIHRLLAIQFLNNPNNYDQIDHIDRNRSNNSLDNLRWCNNQQNSCNRGISWSNKSGVKNIYYEQSRNKWVFKIKIDGKTIKKRFNDRTGAIIYKENFSISQYHASRTHFYSSNMNTIIMK